MKPREIAKRLTGISIAPGWGLSWKPAESETELARRVIAFLEDRRVLYEAGQMEVPMHCVDSVIQIRQFLSAELGKMEGNSELAKRLRAMRASCCKFLQRVQTDDRDVFRQANYPGHYASWIFYGALGEMRGVFGVHLAQIAAQFKLDVEDDLASILPANAEADTADLPTRRRRPFD